jgi:hypothetical protein
LDESIDVHGIDRLPRISLLDQAVEFAFPEEPFQFVFSVRCFQFPINIRAHPLQSGQSLGIRPLILSMNGSPSALHATISHRLEDCAGGQNAQGQNRNDCIFFINHLHLFHHNG